MFRPESAMAMAVYFLMRAPDRKLNDLVLMKLMVMAERQCMKSVTALISGSRFSSMQNGPVLSDVLDMMNGHLDSTVWKRHIRLVRHSGQGATSKHCALLQEDFHIEDYLSEFEVGLLARVWDTYKDQENWELEELTHEFPEWDKSCAQTKSSRPIPLELIFELGLHESPDTARERAHEIEYFEAVTGATNAASSLSAA